MSHSRRVSSILSSHLTKIKSSKTQEEHSLARINVDSEFWNDPRLDALRELVGKYEAVGAVICLWELGQHYWKQERRIPQDIFDRLRFHQELEQAGFVTVNDEGAYCKGATERWDFLLVFSQAGKRGGEKSALIRREKYGSAVPFNATNSEASRLESEAFPKPHDEKPKPPKHSSSSSSSIRSKKRSRRGGAATTPATSSMVLPEAITGEWIHARLTAAAFEELVKIYGDAEFIETCFRRMAVWCDGNRKRTAKSHSGWTRFITSWLRKDWENHRRTIEATQPQAKIYNFEKPGV